MRHNSFSKNYLPFVSLWKELALFRTAGRPAPDSSVGKLALFRTVGSRIPVGLLQIGFVCTDGIGLESWNDGMVGRWGISSAGNWLRFACLSPAAAGLPVLPVCWAIGFVCATAGVAPRELALFVHNGTTHRFCRSPAISREALGILSGISMSLCAALTARQGPKVVAALVVPDQRSP
jgi:hypothetical protein